MFLYICNHTLLTYIIYTNHYFSITKFKTNESYIRKLT